MLYDLIIALLPMLALVCCWLTRIGGNNIQPISTTFILFFVVAMAILMGLYPVEASSDRIRYTDLYYSINDNTFWGYSKDSGWPIFNKICAVVFGRNSEFFFLTISFIYTLSYYIFGKRYFDNDYCGYFVILALGCLGFSTYGIVMVRSALAQGILLLALSYSKSRIAQIALVVISMFIHVSVVIPVFFFIVAKFLKKDLYVCGIWITCLVLSVINFDISFLLEEAMPLDERVEIYATLDSDRYSQGFRIDFVIYSVIPILVAYYYRKKGDITSVLYNQLYRTYILTNAFWLLVIRMAYTNRIAYLSWMLIPYIVLYPIVYNRDNLRNPQNNIFRIMALFMVISFMLAIRDIFFRQ